MMEEKRLVIRPAELAEQERKIKELAELCNRELKKLPSVREKSMLVLDHKVTGREYNILVEAIQKNLESIHDNAFNLIKTLNVISNTINVLDLQYVGRIAESYDLLKESHESVSQKVAHEQERLDEIVKILKEVVDSLETVDAKIKCQHKNLDNDIECLDAIVEDIADDIQMVGEAVDEFKKDTIFRLEELSKVVNQTAESLRCETLSKVENISKKIDQSVENVRGETFARFDAVAKKFENFETETQNNFVQLHNLTNEKLKNLKKEFIESDLKLVERISYDTIAIKKQEESLNQRINEIAQKTNDINKSLIGIRNSIDGKLELLQNSVASITAKEEILQTTIDFLEQTIAKQKMYIDQQVQQMKVMDEKYLVCDMKYIDLANKYETMKKLIIAVFVVVSIMFFFIVGK